MNKIEISNGIYLFSKINNPQNVVIFLHSLSNNYESELALSIIRNLYENNIGVIAFNFSFYANQTNPSHNLKNELNQLKSVIALVEGKLNANYINLVGVSLGSVVAMDYCASTDYDKIKSITIVSLPFKLGFPANLKIINGDSFVDLNYSSQYSYIFNKINMKKFFVVQGTVDDLCDIDEFSLFLKNYKNCSLSLVHGANHGFLSSQNSNFFKECADLVLNKINI